MITAVWGSAFMTGCFAGFLAGIVYTASWWIALSLFAAYVLGLFGGLFSAALCRVAADVEDEDIGYGDPA
jgi:amino acid transporter